MTAEPGMIIIVDYGMGNLRSVEKAFSFLGHAAEVSDDPGAIDGASGVVLPGVGAFGDAMRELERRGLDIAMKRKVLSGSPFLGICLGYQLLFDSSEESPGVTGLGVLPGKVVRFSTDVKIPHMGWNDARVRVSHPVLDGVEDGAFFYFVHSYFVVPSDPGHVLTTTDYGCEFASGAVRDNLVGFQFHPEKSSASGLRILDNFALMCV